MGRITKIILYVVLICVLSTGYIFWHNLSNNFNANIYSQIIVSSPDFTSQNIIPVSFTCQSQNVNPQLSFGNIPDGTISLVIDMVDTNTFAAGYVHWFAWGISPKILSIPKNINQDFISQGLNYFNKIGYSGPCPTSGAHHYRFEVYALDTDLNLKNGANYKEFQSAIKKHIIGYGSLLGLYQYQPKNILKVTANSKAEN